MSFSVNTNQGAFVALQNLASTGKQLGVVQNRINTGLKVSSTKDDSAVFAIAQNLRSEVSGLSAVKSSLDRAKSTLDVAVSASEAVSDVLIQMKEKALAASDTGLDSASRTALANDFNALRDQVKTLVANASFNGTNLIDGGSGAVSALLSDNDSDTGTAGFQADVYSLANQNLALGSGTTAGTNVTMGTTTTFTDAATAATRVGDVETSIANVNTVLSKLGSASRQIDSQMKFVAKLNDTLEVGIGNLVDADLARESAKLQSLQVKQQLGLQALSIANQSPQTVLGLFR